MSTDFDRLLPKSIYAMTVDELLDLAKDVYRFQVQVEKRLKYFDDPPALGVSVADGVKSEDKPG